MFNEEEKKNQHYVPRFWQKRFAGPNGALYGLRDGKVSMVRAGDQMSGDWIYTTWDERGIPSNDLENIASRFEGRAAEIMKSIESVGSLGTVEDQIYLRWFIAFSACRHPDAMGRGHRLAKQVAYEIVDLHARSIADFIAFLESLGCSAEEAKSWHERLSLNSEEDLLAQAEDVATRPPNDPTIPAQLALDPETIETVVLLLAKHDVTILDAPSGLNFILGDTPFPPDLSGGFTVPLSSNMALLWERGEGESFPDWSRRPATVVEVETSNRLQADNALHIVVGCSKNVLQRYVTA